MTGARVSGWLVVALIVAAVAIPLAVRLRHGRRAAPDSQPTRVHVVLGLCAASMAFGHTLAAVLALGSPQAVGGGLLALGAGAAAFVILLAHTGLGLQLRDVKLKRRAEKRRAHVTTAVLIA